MVTRIAVDTSSLVSLISGEKGRDIDRLMDALTEDLVVIPPVVLVESCSNPRTKERVEALVLPMPQLEILSHHWHRAADLRSLILSKGLKANIADTLIAQCCIDHGVALITRDEDFRHFAKHGGLTLAC